MAYNNNALLHQEFNFALYHTPLYVKKMPKSSLQARPDTQRLGKSDWTDASISTLLTEGIDAVQITRLAKTLGVSRGSFY
jgi:hypothetical protein